MRALTFMRGLTLKLFAVALAVALRFIVAGDPIVERGFRVPLEFENLPGSVEIMGDPPETVEVRVRGSSGVLRRLEAGDVVAIVDLGSGRLGDRLFDMMEGGVRAPFGVEVAQVIPSTVSLRLEVEGAPRLVPIVPVTEGEPAAGFVVGGVTVEPAMVEVVGPLSQFRESTEVITESIDLAGTAVPVDETVAVGVTHSRLRLLAPVRARVTVDIVREPVQRGRLTLRAVVVRELERRGPIVSDEAEFLRRHTDHKIIVALPTPSTIADLMWHPQRSAPAYPTREAFARACVPILRDEITAMAALGVDAVQLDEPLLHRLVKPGYYDLTGKLEATVDLAVETVNMATKGFEEIYITVHLCHAHGVKELETPVTSKLMGRAVEEMRAHRLARVTPVAHRQ